MVLFWHLIIKYKSAVVKERGGENIPIQTTWPLEYRFLDKCGALERTRTSLPVHVSFVK